MLPEVSHVMGTGNMGTSFLKFLQSERVHVLKTDLTCILRHRTFPRPRILSEPVQSSKRNGISMIFGTLLMSKNRKGMIAPNVFSFIAPEL